MMKLNKISFVLFGVLMMLATMSFSASAEGEVAKIGDTPYATLAEAVTAANAMDGDVTITLLQDTTFNQMYTITGNITIDGDGHTLYRYDDETDNTLDYTGGLFTVEEGANLTLNNLTIDGNNNWTFNKTAYETAFESSTLSASYCTLEEGAPVAKTSTIYIYGSLTVNNTTIHNIASDVVLIRADKGSSLILNDGTTITRCAMVNSSSDKSNMIFAVNANIILNEGTRISENAARGNGAVTQLRYGSALTMNGGEIINNYGNAAGIIIVHGNTGEVYSSFIMNGGLISGNSAKLSIVSVRTNTTFKMYGGEICNNRTISTSVVCAYNAGANATIYGGTITNNTTLEDGYSPDISFYSGSVTLYGGEYKVNKVRPTNNVILRDIYLDDICAPGYTAYPIDEDDDGEIDIYKVTKMIEIEFEDVSDPNAEIERLYNINVITKDTNLINKLDYIDLTFAFEETEKWIGYEINAVSENVDVHMVDNITPRYKFCFDELDTPAEETDSITIGQVRFTGYGSYTFAVDTSADTNSAYIKDDIEDELVMTYITEVVAGGGYIGFGDSIHEVIPMPKRKLTVNIDFNNSIEIKTAANQLMTFKVGGGTVSKIIPLGNENIDESEEGSIEYPAKVTVSENGYIIELDLPYETTYTVIIEGAGYRTARYSVYLTENKTLNFWNNVMDVERVIEVGRDSSKTTHNFLAGDIIKDDNINIYDLSAILSYFGARNISATNNPDYIKYDINRDGVIDSKDVAYVLVSWGN